VAAIAALLSVLVFCYLGTRKQTALVLMLECVCAACLVALIAWRPVALFRPLDLGVVRFYGKISYSFYLLHLLGILFANQALAAANFPLAALPASFAMITVLIASVLMTTPAAYLSWRYIEVPFINLGKSFKGYRLARG
jgi:peptidoglycan/LPS O-acetylase OafA/YrhL